MSYGVIGNTFGFGPKESRFEPLWDNKMNDEEIKREIKYIRLGFIWSDKGERGFYILPEDAAGIVDLIAEGKINKNGKTILMNEIIRINKEIAKYAYEIMLDKNIIAR